MLRAATEAISPPRRAKARLLAILVIAGASSFLVIAGALSFVVSPPTASASPNSVPSPTPTPPVLVGIDANPLSTPPTGGNTATALGPIEQCLVRNIGDTFTVDFFVKNIAAPGIEAFQGDLSYTSSRLEVTANSVSLMLAAGAGSSVFDGTDTLPDTDGTFTPIGADLGSGAGHSEVGSGVLARITLHAIGNGTGVLILSNVKLADPSFNPIGDTIGGDGVFDGAIAHAQIRIGPGQSCAVGGISQDPDVSSLPSMTREQRGSQGLPYAETVAWSLLVVAVISGAWWMRRPRRR